MRTTSEEEDYSTGHTAHPWHLLNSVLASSRTLYSEIHQPSGRLSNRTPVCCGHVQTWTLQTRRSNIPLAPRAADLLPFQGRVNTEEVCSISFISSLCLPLIKFENLKQKKKKKQSALLHSNPANKSDWGEKGMNGWQWLSIQTPFQRRKSLPVILQPELQEYRWLHRWYYHCIVNPVGSKLLYQSMFPSFSCV